MPRFLVLLLMTATASAQDLSTFEKFLVPVLNQSQAVEGANGSSFHTSFGARTGDLQPITYYPAGTGEPRVGRTDPHLLAVRLWKAPVIAKGRFVFIERSASGAVLFAGIMSVSPDGAARPAPLPVIGESDALTSTSTFGVLLSDPIYSEKPPPGSNWPSFLAYRQRHTLRVYDFGAGGGEVEVRLIWASWLSLGIVATRRLSLTSRDFDHPTYPYYAEVDLGQAFGDRWCYPALRVGCSALNAIIEVVPVTEGLRYYAFVSTTDNFTNQVVVYTPR